VAFVNNYIKMPRKVKPSEVYTNQFVEKTRKEWRTVK
jgi:hypothetical protein